MTVQAQFTTNTLAVKVLVPPTSSSDDLDELRQRFERFGSVISFILFKSLRRALVIYDDPSAAAMAKMSLHQTILTGGSHLLVYFTENTPVDPPPPVLLEPPPNPKAFFTSPPASPPEDWRPAVEPPPVRDASLELALANLRVYELYTSNSDLPSIIVEDTDFDAVGDNGFPMVVENDIFATMQPTSFSNQNRRHIPQTHRPPLPPVE